MIWRAWVRHCRNVAKGVALLLLLVGCASTPPPIERYLLTDPEPELPPVEGPAVQVGLVTVPPYLQAKGIVVALESSQLQEAHQHRWAEPLGSAISRYLVSRLPTDSAAAPLLDVQILHFHGQEAGPVLLEVEWSLRNRGADQPLASERFSQTLTQRAPGYSALVEAHRSLLDALLLEVRSAVVAEPTAADDS